jgi:hypothetical protein
MKTLHKPDLYAWSAFDAERNIDFNSYVWVRSEGNVVIDPMPMSSHDRQHLEQLGGVSWVVITNSDHVRDSAAIASAFGAQLAGPAAEQEGFPIACQRWLADGDELVPGLKIHEMHGSKTPGELVLLLQGHTLFTGDLVRAHRGGSLMMLPPPKLKNPERARESVRRLLELGDFDAVLVGDGWPVFRDGRERLEELVAGMAAP